MKLPFLSKSIVSIDIGSYETKVIEAKKNNNNIQVIKTFSILTPEGSYNNGYIKNESLLIEKIKQGLKDNNISSKEAYLTIKSTAIITREILFPVLSSKEIEGMLKYQLEEYLPMDISRYTVQHRIIGKTFDAGTEKVIVLVVAIPKDIVEKHYFLLNNLNLKPLVMDYQSNSISKILKYSSIVNYSDPIPNKTIAAIDLGHSGTNVSIIEEGVLQTSRVIEIGGEDLDNNILNLFQFRKEELLEKKEEIIDISVLDGSYSDYNRLVNVTKTTIESIIDKIEKVIKFYTSKELGNEVNIIILYGGLSNIKGIDKLFSNYFRINTIVLESIDKVNIQTNLNKYINSISSILRDEEV